MEAPKILGRVENDGYIVASVALRFFAVCARRQSGTSRFGFWVLLCSQADPPAAGGLLSFVSLLVNRII